MPDLPTDSQYLNTDLCLESATDLHGLVADLRKQAFCLHLESPADAPLADQSSQWSATLEAVDSGEPGRRPDQDLEILLEAVESLSGRSQADWSSCSRREFNIGWQASEARPEGSFQLAPALLQGIATVGAVLAVTIYPSSECN